MPGMVLSNTSYNNEQEMQRNKFWLSNTYDPQIKFGGTVCDPATQESLARTGEKYKQILIKACEKWLDPEAKNQSFQIVQGSSATSVWGRYIFTNSIKDYTVKKNGSSFYLEIPYADFSNPDTAFYVVDINIHNGACTQRKEYCNFHNGNIQIVASQLSTGGHDSFYAQENGQSVRYLRVKALGSFGSENVINMFNTFQIQYPADYPEEDKILRSRPIPESEKPKLEDFYPRAAVSIKDKHLDAIIINLNSKGENALNITQTRPSFSIYDEKKEREIFTYHGSNLTDRFIYDFENYGKYYLKTIVTQPPPLIVGEGKYTIHQPVWTEILIDGGTYSIFPHGETSSNCVGDACALPDSAKSCVGRFQDISGSVGCEFRKLNDFLKSKLGFLWAPVDILARTASNFQRADAVSCSVGQGLMRINACPISEKFPQLYSFLNMVANGSLLFGFVMFLRNQLSGFVSERGGA